MTIQGNIEGFKERLEQEYDKDIKQLEKKHQEEISRLQEEYRKKWEEREKEYERHAEKELSRIRAEEDEKANKEADRIEAGTLDDIYSTVTSKARRLLRDSGSKQALYKNTSYLARLKEQIKELDRPKIIAHTTSFSTRLRRKVKTDKTITGVVIEDDDVVFDNTFETFLRENADGMKNMLGDEVEKV